MNIRCLIALLLFVIKASDIKADSVSFRSYGLDFGLSDNSIRGIAEDKYGFIWIATDEGLNKMSGRNIERYYKFSRELELPGNELNCLVDDPVRPIMWIGGQREGIVAYNYDTGKYERYKKEPDNPGSLVANEVTDFDFDNKGNLWVSTYSGGIDCLDEEKGVFVHYNANNVKGLASNEFWCIEYDNDTGEIYGGHVRDGLSVISPTEFNATNFNEKSGLSGNEVWDIASDKHYVWISTDKGLSRYDKNTHEITNFNTLGYDDVSRSLLNFDDRLLVAMDNHGILLFDKITHEFSTLPTNYSTAKEDYPEFLWRSDPNRLFLDSHDNIIVGTLYEGLAVISGDIEGFMVMHIYDDTSRDTMPKTINVRDITAGKDGAWFATNGSGLVGTGGVTTSDIDVVAVHCDNNNHLWVVGNDNLLTEIDLMSGESVRHNIGIDGSRSVNFVSDGDTLWIGSSHGLYLFDKRLGKVTRHTDIDRNYIFSMDIDNNGNLWVGSYGDGVSVIDRNGKLVKKYTRRTGLPSNTINDICVVENEIWLASGEGVIKVNGDNLDDFAVVADSMHSIKSVVNDRMGNIWYATKLGVGVLTKEGDRKFFDSNLPLSGFNNSSAARGNDGRLYFGTNYGVLTFMPEYVLSGKWLPELVISEFTTHSGTHDSGTHDSGKKINVLGRDVIDLDFDENNFTITVSPSNIFVDKLLLEYRLLGMDDKWYPINDDGTVTLRDIPYGEYEFQVRNSIMKDNENSKTATMQIHIAPPFWLQWWAKLIYIIIIAGVVYGIFRWCKNRIRKRAMINVEAERLENQKALQDERVRFFTNVTHELRTPLTLINGPLEDLLKGNTLSDGDRWKVDVIHKNALRLLTLVNQLLDYRKTETNNKRLCVRYDNIISHVKEVAMKYVELNRNPNVTITVNASMDDIRAYFDKEVLTQILDNLISNAMKYTEAGIITVSVMPEHREDGRWIKISVKDTGYGIGKEALPYIFDSYYQENSAHQASGTGIGLALVKALVELHKGEISVESAKDVGSCFNFYLRRDEDYAEAVHIEAEETDYPNNDSLQTKRENDTSDAIGDSRDNIEVLVVEDNPDILEYIRQSISGVYNVKTATNGRDGLEMALRDMPDIIVTDIMMPIMDGMEMTHRLKNNITTSHVPIVMLTAKDSPTDRQEGYDIGVDSYITKPFNASLLIARINNIISRRHMLSEYLKSHIDENDNTEKDNAKVDVHDNDCSKFNESLGKLDQEFMEKLDHAILDCDNPEKVNLEYLTDVMCMSRATLYRKMKAVTGMSGNEYIRHVRMKRAKEMILQGELSLTEIAYRLGFSSAGYFRETFKNVFGKSPTEYLKSLRQEKS